MSKTVILAKRHSMYKDYTWNYEKKDNQDLLENAAVA